MARVSSLETQVLERRAALASAEADKTGMVSELEVSRETAGRVEELKAAMAEAATREEALRVEMTASKNALEVGKTFLARRVYVDSKSLHSNLKPPPGLSSWYSFINRHLCPRLELVRTGRRGIPAARETYLERDKD